MSYPARAEGLVNRITSPTVTFCLIKTNVTYTYLDHISSSHFPASSNQCHSVYNIVSSQRNSPANILLNCLVNTKYGSYFTKNFLSVSIFQWKTFFWTTETKQTLLLIFKTQKKNFFLLSFYLNMYMNVIIDISCAFPFFFGEPFLWVCLHFVLLSFVWPDKHILSFIKTSLNIYPQNIKHKSSKDKTIS